MTNDGSHSIAVRGDITYHSVHGAIQESRHIFIGAGLKPLLGRSPRPLSIFEVGFGTGLNALLTLIEAADAGQPIRYETVDVQPLTLEMAARLNYCARLGRPDLLQLFLQIHACPWGTELALTPTFTMIKAMENSAGYRLSRKADLVYYDVFDPTVQPELWTEEVFTLLAGDLAPGAALVTYCCKGTVRRALQAAGFAVEKLPGPPGKREILRATRRPLPYENE